MNKPKVFTRENPCTKVDLWNCFRQGGKFVSVPVVQAQSVIGVNVPKYLLREGYATAVARKGVDYYTLSRAGESWLQSGVTKHLQRHPSDQALLMESIPGGPSATASGTSSATVVVRRRPR